MKLLLQNYEDQVQSFHRSPAVKLLNDDGYNHLRLQQWPTRKEEEWKYANLGFIKEKKWNWLSVPSEEQVLKCFNQQEGEEDTLYFFDGHFIEGLSDRFLKNKKNVELILSENKEFASKLLFFNQISIGFEDILRSINSAYANNILILKFIGKEKKKIHIKNFETHLFSEKSFSTPRILLYVEEGAKAHCEVEMVSESIDFVSSVIDAFVGKDAELDLTLIGCPKRSKSMNLSSRVQLMEGSKLTSSNLVFGSQISRFDQTICADEENSFTDIAIAYIADEDHEVDINSCVNHHSPRGKSYQLIKGIAKNESRANIRGRIYIQKDAQEIDSKLLNKNMLLSEYAEVNTKPELEVEADNVKAAHGATVSQLEDEELFYLESRGINRNLASQLLLKGFVLDVFKNMEDKNSSVFKILEGYFE